MLEDLAGSIPESEPNLAIVSRDGRVVRVNTFSGAWCVLIDNPSNPLPYFSCSEIDTNGPKEFEPEAVPESNKTFLGALTAR